MSRSILSALIPLFLCISTTNALALSYDDWSVGKVRTNVTSAIHQDLGVNICYDAPKARMIEGTFATKIMEAYHKELDFPEMTDLLQHPDARAIYIEVLDHTEQPIKYLYIPYPTGFAATQGHLMRLNPIFEDPEPIPLDEDCVSCIRFSGWTADASSCV